MTGPADRSPLDPNAAFAELAHVDLGEQTLATAMQRVAELTVRVVAGADEVSVTLLHRNGRRPETVAHTGRLAVDLDERQYERDHGPCSSYAAVALANIHLHESTARLARDLRTAMESRAVIEQAKGMLMARFGVDADTAFAVLTRISSHANRKLREIAEDVVAGRVQPG